MFWAAKVLKHHKLYFEDAQPRTRKVSCFRPGEIYLLASKRACSVLLHQFSCIAVMLITHREEIHPFWQLAHIQLVIDRIQRLTKQNLAG